MSVPQKTWPKTVGFASPKTVGFANKALASFSLFAITPVDPHTGPSIDFDERPSKGERSLRGHHRGTERVQAL